MTRGLAVSACYPRKVHGYSTDSRQIIIFRNLVSHVVNVVIKLKAKRFAVCHYVPKIACGFQNKFSLHFFTSVILVFLQELCF